MRAGKSTVWPLFRALGVFLGLMAWAFAASADDGAGLGDPVARSGEVGLTGPLTLAGNQIGGELTEADARELTELGGAILLSGTSPAGQCPVQLQIGDIERHFTLGKEPSVVHLELYDVSAGRLWTLSTEGCRAQLEGALLFVGSAAAYVGEEPGIWWASARETLSPGVQ